MLKSCISLFIIFLGKIEYRDQFCFTSTGLIFIALGKLFSLWHHCDLFRNLKLLRFTVLES